MPQILQVAKRKPSGNSVIEHDVRHILNLSVPRHRHRRKLQLLRNRSVRRNKSLDAARHQHLRVSLQQRLVVAMDHRQEEIILAAQILFDPADHQRTIRVADLFRDHANGVRSLQAQRARQQVIRPIVQILRFGREDAFLGSLRNRARRCGIIQGRRNRAGSQPQALGDSLQRYSRLALLGVVFLLRGGHAPKAPSAELFFSKWGTGTNVDVHITRKSAEM